MSDSEDPVDIGGDEVDDLFGDGDDGDDVQSDNERAVSDADLASDKDVNEHRYDDGMDVDDREVEVENRLVMNIQLYRHRAPKSKDGTVRRNALDTHNCAILTASS
jgi:RNA polymerase-associated protein LEO1